MRILVVDDEQGLRHTLTLILNAESHETRAAHDGASALEMLRQSDADLVLCDVRMPGMDGLAFLDAYKRNGGRAPVIMMSAYGDDAFAVDAIRRGAHDFIQKPFRADQVLLVLAKAAERQGLREQVQRLSDEIERLRRSLPKEPDAINSGDPNDLSVKRRTEALERSLILRALKETDGNRTRAAKLLDLSPRALLYKIREYGIE